ncbi:alpha-L-rhamnosidase [Nocardioides nitrophenolicus]|uniref:alpha-L-rhamnosidase n=1 Tax=Nocardioides nitrophenolicus TaxID=60489 RepID=UPI00195ADD08|nr:alpha-L-rhamnosidase [Nocardioides nitrophenolicus]MBM7517391.1 alpha-L-rhamnosidase [Nocardioides nitrophenolicus]
MKQVPVEESTAPAPLAVPAAGVAAGLPVRDDHRPRAGFRRHPLGLPVRATTLTWEPGAALTPGTDYVVTATVAGEQVWRTVADRPVAVLPAEVAGTARRVEWQVRSADDAWASEPATVEFGLADAAAWQAPWIAAPANPFARETDDPAPYLRREVELAEVPEAARLYVTALGIYRIWVNGTEITADDLLRPGWTEYGVRVHHQTFAVEEHLRPGRNVVAVILAKGWYAGRLGLLRYPGLYGERPALRLQLEATTAAGERTLLLGTSPEWRASTGAIRATDMLRGEILDLRREPTGWTEPGYDDGAWSAVETITPDPHPEITPQPHDSVSVLEVRTGELVREHGRGPVVFDFGQNLVGWTRITSALLPRTEVVVRTGEMLTPEDLVYRDNLRGAFQEDRIAGDGEGRQTLETRFTVHGFRYAEIWGLPSDNPYGNYELPAGVEVEAVTLTALPEEVGRFESSNELLNEFASAVEWTVRDNFIEVPTDCPQRDERLGWLGDAGVISPTARYFLDVAAFLGKFVQDIADTQGPDGEVWSYVPPVPPGNQRPGAPGWADGFVRMAHVLADTYGDLTTVDRIFPALERFAAHVDRENPDGLRVNAVGADFADWLSLPEKDGEPTHPGYAWTGARSTAPRPVVGTAHTYRTLRQLADLARWTGRDAEAARLDERAEEVRAAYRKAFVGAGLEIAGATQTVYAQAIGFGLFEGEDATVAAERLAAMVRSRGYVTTGIHGVQHVMPALMRHGHADLAYDVLLREDMPGWLYMAARGATTVWEKWDGLRPDATLSTAQMNSFNHCALGAVGASLFEEVAGIAVGGALRAGRIEVRPVYSERLGWAGAVHDSALGRVGSRWVVQGERVDQEVAVPAGATVAFTAPEGWQLDGGATTADLAPGCHRLALVRSRR